MTVEETTFDIGVKMQDDVDIDPTYADRSKVSDDFFQSLSSSFQHFTHVCLSTIGQ